MGCSARTIHTRYCINEQYDAAILASDIPPGYAELHCLSSFSFLRSASQPQELAERADALGYDALALTDEC